MLKVKSLLDDTNLFSPNEYEKNDEIILKYLTEKLKCNNYIALFAVIIKNLKILKYHTFWNKQFFLLCAVSVKMKMKKYLKKKNKLRYYKFLV